MGRQQAAVGDGGVRAGACIPARAVYRASAFTAKERDLIRHEFMERPGGSRRLDEGFLVRRWATGPKAGQPKLLAAIGSMLERGLVTLVDDGARWPHARFTDDGWRALPPKRFRHLLEDLAASTRGR